MLILLAARNSASRDLHLVEENVAGLLRDAAQRGVANGARLLINFLEHEMLEAALFRHDRVPGHVLHLALDRLAVEVGELHAVGSDHRHVAVGQKENVARVIENRGHVGGHEVFVVPQADHRRRAIARRHDLVGIVGRDHRQGEHAAQSASPSAAPPLRATAACHFPTESISRSGGR